MSRLEIHLKQFRLIFFGDAKYASDISAYNHIHYYDVGAPGWVGSLLKVPIFKNILREKIENIIDGQIDKGVLGKDIKRNFAFNVGKDDIQTVEEEACFLEFIYILLGASEKGTIPEFPSLGSSVSAVIGRNLGSLSIGSIKNEIISLAQAETTLKAMNFTDIKLKDDAVFLDIEFQSIIKKVKFEDSYVFGDTQSLETILPTPPVPPPEDLYFTGLPFAGVDTNGDKVFVWGTNYPSTSKVYWGTSIGSQPNTFPVDNTLVEYHRQAKFIGAIDTIIYYYVVSTTPLGASITSAVYSFAVSSIVAVSSSKDACDIVMTNLGEVDQNIALSTGGWQTGYEVQPIVSAENLSVPSTEEIVNVDQNITEDTIASGEFTGFVKLTAATVREIIVTGIYTDSVARIYKVEIDGVGSPDTFKWSDDNGSTWTETTKNCAVTAYALNHGISVTFGVSTGHAVGQFWTFNRKP
jgi:hypothetical protein